jgi:hypothetical protein
VAKVSSSGPDKSFRIFLYIPHPLPMRKSDWGNSRSYHICVPIKVQIPFATYHHYLSLGVNGMTPLHFPTSKEESLITARLAETVTGKILENNYIIKKV